LADLLDSFGPYTTRHNRFIRWRRAGIWGTIMDALVDAAKALGSAKSLCFDLKASLDQEAQLKALPSPQSGGLSLGPQCLSTIGLVLGMLGVVLIFLWGPPQPDLDERIYLTVAPNTVFADGIWDIVSDLRFCGSAADVADCEFAGSRSVACAAKKC
jgi:hypothetical protein